MTADRSDPAIEALAGDRRRDERIPVELRVVEMGDEVAYFRFATNLSAGGLFIQGPLPLPVGTKLTLVFIIPGDDGATSVPCEVVGSTDGDYRGNHIKFLVDDSSEVTQSLRAYVRARTES